MAPGLKLLAVLVGFGWVLWLIIEEYGVGWMFAATSIAGSLVISAAVARVNDEIEAHHEEKRLASKKPGPRSLDPGDTWQRQPGTRLGSHWPHPRGG